MKRIWNYISINSIAVLSTKEVMLILTGSLFVFHMFLMLFFAYFRICPLVLLNVGSTALYAVCYRQAQKQENLLRIFNLTYVEIIIHAMTATLLVGEKSGFMLYLVMLVPLGYYAFYNFSRDKKRVNPMWYILLTGVFFSLTKVLCSYITPLYSYGNVRVDHVIYLVNYFVTVVAIVGFFSTLMNQVRILEEMREKQNKRLEELSKMDALTGLVNRRGLWEEYQKYKVRNESYAVILGDIDDFKKINDAYGHDVGDTVLQAVAEVFQNTVGQEGIVCRWGGEEVLVYLPGCKREKILRLAEEILAGVRELKLPGQENLGVTMTMGIAASHEVYELNLAVQKADERLYSGKRNGKNQIVWK